MIGPYWILIPQLPSTHMGGLVDNSDTSVILTNSKALTMKNLQKKIQKWQHDSSRKQQQ